MIVVYCDTGTDSSKLCANFPECVRPHTAYLEGGIIGWANARGNLVSATTKEVVRCLNVGHSHASLLDPAADVVAVHEPCQADSLPECYIIRENPYDNR